MTGVRTLENLTSGMMFVGTLGQGSFDSGQTTIVLPYNHANEEVRNSGDQRGSRTSEMSTHHEASRERLL